MKNKSANYSAWQIQPKDFPYDERIEQQLKFLAKYGILAPSMHNTQPWQYEICKNQLTVSPASARNLKIADKNNFGIYIAIGSFIENIIQAAKAYGLSVEFAVKNDDHVLTFSSSANKKVDLIALQNIVNRYSDKNLYHTQRVETSIIKELTNIGDKDTNITVFQPGEEFNHLVLNHLVAAGKVAKNKSFGRELAKWLRPNNTKDDYGMPGFVSGQSFIQSLIGKKLLSKKPELLSKMIPKEELLLKSSSLLIVVSINGEGNKNKLVKAGMVIERLWLTIVEHGLVGHPMFASIQVNSTRKEVDRILGKGAQSCFLMRVGFTDKEIVHTPRAIMHDDLHGAVNQLASTLSSSPQNQKLKIGKYTINYVTMGQGQPVLLIHGANIGWPQWHLNIDYLAKYFKVYAIDLPGSGESSKVTFSKTDFYKDYLDVVDKFIQILGLNQLSIVGSSFGGWVAMRLAIEHRPYIKRIVVTNPIGFTKHMPLKFRPVSITPLAMLMSKTVLRPKRSNKNLEKFMRDVFHKKDIPLKNEFVDYFYELSKTSHNVLFISRLAHYSGMREELFLGDMLPSIDIPVLIIWGKQDPLMPYHTVEHNMKKIENASLKVLENVGHMPPVESPSLFNRETVNFLRAKK
ncbi:MAG: alpha/beta fold hydrolase [Candidatus Saccharimonadales bacterium]